MIDVLPNHCYAVAVMALNGRQRQFVIEYLIDFNGTKAAIRAGYSEATSGQIAFQLLQNPEILAAIEDEQQQRAAAAGLSAQWVLTQWKKIAEADPNELIRMRLECCRYCYGIGHQYQWTEPEYLEIIRAVGLHQCGRKCSQPCRLIVPPSAAGGFGFDRRLSPAEDCPQCHGEGVERVLVADTKRVTGSARRLYAGVKQTKDGIEIKMRDQDAALQNIAKYLGMLVDKRELSTPDGKPIAVSISANDLTDDQLASIASQALAEVS